MTGAAYAYLPQNWLFTFSHLYCLDCWLLKAAFLLIHDKNGFFLGAKVVEILGPPCMTFS